MTIASQTSRISYTGDGATTAFPVPFYFAANADLVVILQDTLGNQVTQLLGTHYNLTGATLSAGGTCTFVVAPITGYLVTIYRDPQLTQTTSYNNNDPFPAKSHELALDKALTIDQRTRDLVNRSLRLSDGEGATSVQLASIANRKNRLLGFDTNGALAYTAGATTGSTSANGIAIVDTKATAQTLVYAGSINVVRTAGLSVAGDGGGLDYIRGNISSPSPWQDASGGYWTAATLSSIRWPNPVNLYVSKTGNDSSKGLTAGTAFLTIQHAVNVAVAQYDFQGSSITINIGAGVYAEQVNVFGPIGGPGTSYAALILKGAGSTTTSINPSTNCGAGANCLVVNSYARVGLGSIKLTTTCANGSDLIVINNSVVYLADSDVNFGAAPNALVDVADGSAFDCNGGGAQSFTISGGGTFAFLISTQSRVVTGVGVTNVITGTPAFSGAFIDAIDGSFFNQGGSSSFSGSATGIRYALALNSYIDTEQIVTLLPGSIPGNVQNGSYYYTNLGLACVGGNGGCSIATAPTGGGAGATYSLGAGSGDQSGVVRIVAGAGAASTGTLHVSLNSQVNGALGTNGFCVVALNDGSAAWPVGSSVRAFYASASTGGDITIKWDSNGVALTNGGAYSINYIVQ